MLQCYGIHQLRSLCVCKKKHTHTHTHSYFPTLHHIHLVSIKAYEHKFPNMQYFGLVPFFIYYHKLQWTNRSSTSRFECI